MDDRDRDSSSGSSGRYSRRRLPDEENGPVRRRSRSDGVDDAPRTRPEDRRNRTEQERDRPSRESSSRAPRDQGRYRSTARDESEPGSWSVDRFRRTDRRVSGDADDRSPSSTRDPYDRLRRVGNRPPRRVDVDRYDDPPLDAYGDDDYDESPPVIDRRRAGRPTVRSTTPGVRQQQIRSMGALVANPSPELRPIVVGALISAGSLILLAILTLIRGGDLPAWLPTRWNAEGDPMVFGTSSTAWRLPVFVLFSTVMALGLGWWLRVREPFAAQFLSVGVLLIHGLIWISAITLLW